jgi:PHD/YefM family antitoxin component YafN of YafNO toxin-antitoxin module
MDTVSIPRAEFEQMQRELKTLRETAVYKRLLEFESNIQQKRFTRKDLGF